MKKTKKYVTRIIIYIIKTTFDLKIAFVKVIKKNQEIYSVFAYKFLCKAFFFEL